ncbi:MAG: hypothetical protein RI637_10615 [Acidimicrobiia bacterium]|nr:hypothetical protein [Acidimicrobiia bacterium]
MAYEIGTASDHVDLFNKIRDFLTTNTTLVNAGENWEQMLGSTGVLTASDQITLRGPGLSNSDNIYCGLDLTESASDDRYNLRIWGHAAFSPTIAPHEQSLQSRDTYVFLWNQPIDYWLIANGRRWMLATKISTVYTSAYVGFFLPYGTPSEYPYPMYVAGISGTDRRWSSEDERDRFFVSPGYAMADVYYPDNVWRMVANQGDDHDDRVLGAYGSAYTYPFIGGSDWNGPSSDTMIYNTAKCFDGSYVMRDVILCANDPYDSYLGVLDGAYWVPGRENSSENVVTKDTVEYVVFQNMYRNGFRDYMALRLT